MAIKDFPSPVRVCHCKSTDLDPLVKNDLSITPRRMYELTMQGHPISEQTAAYAGDFIDGYRGDKLSFEPPHIYTRHADIISCWNEQIDSRRSIGEKVSAAQEKGAE